MVRLHIHIIYFRYSICACTCWGIIGVNVFVVLITGIISGIVIMLVMGEVTLEALLLNMGSGASGMFETCMVAVLVSVMCSLIKEYGGFDAYLME